MTLGKRYTFDVCMRLWIVYRPAMQWGYHAVSKSETFEEIFFCSDFFFQKFHFFLVLLFVKSFFCACSPLFAYACVCVWAEKLKNVSLQQVQFVHIYCKYFSLKFSRFIVKHTFKYLPPFPLLSVHCLKPSSFIVSTQGHCP